MIRLFTVFALAATLASPVIAADFQRLLLPVSVRDVVPGANGAWWTTELAVQNRGETDVLLGPCAAGFPADPDPAFACLPDLLTLPARSVIRDPLVAHTPAGIHGQFVYLLTRDLANVQFALALLQGGRAVARLPVVREAEFTDGTLSLLDVPSSAAARTTLRLYGLGNHPATARLQVFAMDAASTPLLDVPIALTPSPFGTAAYPAAPSYAEVALDRTAAGESVRVVLSEIAGDRLWAMATITSAAGDSVVVFTPEAY